MYLKNKFFHSFFKIYLKNPLIKLNNHHKNKMITYIKINIKSLFFLLKPAYLTLSGV